MGVRACHGLEHALFLTGHLAEPRLRQVLASIGATPFTWEVRNVGVKVAALMTPEIIRRRLGPVGAATRIVLPGRCKGDLAALGRDLGVPVRARARGGQGPAGAVRPQGASGAISPRTIAGSSPRSSRRSTLAVDEILRRAAALRGEGADVIDLGCLPDTPFPQLEEAVRALQAAGYRVSVDSGDPGELRRGARVPVPTSCSA